MTTWCHVHGEVLLLSLCAGILPIFSSGNAPTYSCPRLCRIVRRSSCPNPLSQGFIKGDTLSRHACLPRNERWDEQSSSIRLSYLVPNNVNPLISSTLGNTGGAQLFSHLFVTLRSDVELPAVQHRAQQSIDPGVQHRAHNPSIHLRQETGGVTTCGAAVSM